MDSAARAFLPAAPPLSGGCRALRLPACDGAPALDLWLALPEGERPAEGWPLMLVLEGAAYFTAAAEAARRLARRTQKTRVGPTLVLGVDLAERTDRLGAFAFAPGVGRQDQAVAPRGPTLLRRLVEEVLPLAVAAGADPARLTLMGHSMSGLFVLEARARSAPFARHVAASPSIWWNPAVIGEQPRRPEGTTDLLVAVGAEEEAPGLPPPHLARRMIANARDLLPRGGVRLRVLAEEDHGSTPFALLPAALRFAAEGD